MKYFILTGEASADLHASAVVKKIKEKNVNAEFYGIGGKNLKEAEVELIYDIDELNFMGFIEVIKNIKKIKEIRKNIVEFIVKKNIKNIILVDYPGLNLHLAEKLKKLNKNIIYFISPQIWAWHESRAYKIKKYVDTMICILPFEVDFYKKYEIEAYYEGHPLVDRIHDYNYLAKEELFIKHDLNPEKEILLLLPGSRKQEIDYLFNDMLISANKLAVKHNLQIAVACSQNFSEEYFKQINRDIFFKVIKDSTYDLFKHSKFAIIKSGTSTLEAALHGLPFIVIYKTNKLNYMLGKKLVKVAYISLVNLIFNKSVVTELIQDDVNIARIFNTIDFYLNNEINLQQLKSNVKSIINLLGDYGVTERIANLIIEKSI
ncbi:MAG TPA: lipid-A-disaccharide synthase [Ignavibacteriales bacterium]|nr:lipid-A-disaccharide synthase [Ignavibacteriales bacterium]